MFNFGPQEFFWLFIIVLPFILLPGILYALTLYRALSRCALDGRVMEPGLVWLLFIPIFNLIWNFVVVSKMATSLQNEFKRRGVTEPVDSGRELGLAMSILSCLSVIPSVGILCAPAGMICWIIYWVKIAGLSGRLAAPGPVTPVTV